MPGKLSGIGENGRAKAQILEIAVIRHGSSRTLLQGINDEICVGPHYDQKLSHPIKSA